MDFETKSGLVTRSCNAALLMVGLSILIYVAIHFIQKVW
jgi:hypothetical protein